MDWELIIWGLLLGIVGMVWMMVAAIWKEDTRQAPAANDALDSSDQDAQSNPAHTTDRRAQAA